MSAARILTQVIVVGTQIFGKAVVEAYRQVAANAAANSAAASGAKGATAMANYKLGMTVEEAVQILNVRKDAPVETITRNYEHLFKANEPSTGGSFYIQSKVVRAKERLETELGKRLGADQAEAASQIPNKTL